MDTNAWRTPRCLRRWIRSYAYENNIHIVGDACASDANHMDARFYYTEEEDAMNCDWSTAKGAKSVASHTLSDELYSACICCDSMGKGSIDYWVANFPYGRTNKGYTLTDWFRKAYNQALKGIGVIMIVPAANGEQNRWGKYVFGKARIIYNVERRLAFGDPDTGKEERGCAFGTWVVIYDPVRLCQRGAACSLNERYDTVIKPLYLWPRRRPD